MQTLLCLHPRYIYIYEILALFQVHSIAVSNPCPNTRLTSSSGGKAYVSLVGPYVSPSSATHHESNLGDTFAFNPPSRCPPETCPPHPQHTYLLFVCWFVHKVPLKMLCHVLKAAYLRQVKDVPDTVQRWHCGKVSIACHLKPLWL